MNGCFILHEIDSYFILFLFIQLFFGDRKKTPTSAVNRRNSIGKQKGKSIGKATSTAALRRCRGSQSAVDASHFQRSGTLSARFFLLCCSHFYTFSFHLSHPQQFFHIPRTNCGFACCTCQLRSLNFMNLIASAEPIATTNNHHRINNSGTMANSGANGPATGPPRVSLRDLCSLFCCPPLPSSIVAKLAFMPPEPSYRILTSDSGQTSLELIEGRTEWPHGQEELRNVEVFFARTAKRNKIACMFVKPCPNARFTLLFSHGNAVDIGQMGGFYFGLGYRLGCNVFSYDYSGYGQSTGHPSEKNLYADIAAALKALETRCQVPPEQVILYGQSIGTVPSVDLASSCPRVAALILHSPLLSGMRVAFPGTSRTWCCDAFPSIEKIPRVTCPTLIIHGTADDVIEFSHGQTMYAECPSAVDPLWVEGAGHNDVELHSIYLERLRAFIEHEVTSSADKTTSTTDRARSDRAASERSTSR